MLRLIVAAIALVVSRTAFPAPPVANPVPQAQALIDKQQFRAALRLLDEVQKQDGGSLEISYLRGYVLYRLGELGQARVQLEAVTRAAPPALRSRYFLGRIALQQAHPEEAIRWLKSAAEATPLVEDSPAQLGKAYLEAHQLPEAQQWTEKAVTLTPWDGALHYRLARIYQELGQREKATQQFEASAQLHGQDRAAVQDLLQASKDIARGDMEGARAIKSSLLKQPQLDPDVLVSLGSSFATAGKPEEALDLFEEAAKRDSSLFQARFDWGLALLKLGHADEAISPLRDCLRIAPGSADGNAALGLAYVMTRKFEEAVPPLEVAHAARPEDFKTGGLLSLAYLRTGASPKAIPLIQTSLQRQKNDPKLYFLLIECLNSTEDQTGALLVAEEAAQKFPNLAKAHLAKGQQLARLGRYVEAGPSFAKAVELAPGEREALLGLAEVQNKSGNYNDSLATYRQVLAIDATDLTAQLGAAKNLIATGKMAEAKDQLEKASAAHFDNPQIHFELSRVYARLGDRDGAAEQTRIVERLRSNPQ
ncbi:MAG: tetratricopeptide repeat protein [Acidobacteriaceae bacterium]|nr:tetratricopeptide repeat protein [Acidobacteriaceae bacterium]